MTEVRIDALRGCLAGVCDRLGLATEDADGLAGLLLDSELRGHPDHGVAALALLTQLYPAGRLNPRPEVRVLSETDGALLIDGDGGCGPGPPTHAMTWCIERARERRGVAVAAVRDWSMVVGAPYVRQAAEAGLIGFACTNFIPLVAPPGGRTPSSAPIPSPTGCRPRATRRWCSTWRRPPWRCRRSASRPRRASRCRRGSSSIAPANPPPTRWRSSTAARWRRSGARTRRTRASGWRCSSTR